MKIVLITMILILVACGKNERAKAVPSIMKLPVSLSEQTSTLTDSDGDGISDESDPMPHVVEHSSNRFNNDISIVLLDEQGQMVDSIPLLKMTRANGDSDDLVYGIPTHLKSIISSSMRGELEKSKKIHLSISPSETSDFECDFAILFTNKNGRAPISNGHVNCGELSKESSLFFELKKSDLKDLLEDDSYFAINFNKRLENELLFKIELSENGLLYWVVPNSNYLQEIQKSFASQKEQGQLEGGEIVEHKEVALVEDFIFKRKSVDTDTRLYFRIYTKKMVRAVTSQIRSFLCKNEEREFQKTYSHFFVTQWKDSSVSTMSPTDLNIFSSVVHSINKGLLVLDASEDSLIIKKMQSIYSGSAEITQDDSVRCSHSRVRTSTTAVPSERVDYFIEYWVVR